MPPLDANLLNGLRLGLEGEHQYLNAGLAVALCCSWLQRTGHAEAAHLEHAVSSTKETFFSKCQSCTLTDFFLFLHGIELFARAVHKRINNSKFARTGADCP